MSMNTGKRSRVGKRRPSNKNLKSYEKGRQRQQRRHDRSLAGQKQKALEAATWDQETYIKEMLAKVGITS